MIGVGRVAAKLSRAAATTTARTAGVGLISRVPSPPLENFDEAIKKLQRIRDLTHSSIALRVAATEALIGLHLELGQDDASSVLADICVLLLDTIKLEIGGGCGFGVLDARAKALGGLVELVQGNLESAEPFFQGAQENNVFSVEVLLAATCALGQLESHLGNFGNAEDILTRALRKAEEHFGSHYPKVRVVLTCIVLMFRQKAMMEHSNSLLIQKGLYRRAIDLLKAPPLKAEGAETKVRRDILALARGGYAETLCIQQNRKVEGERLKSWAESVWRNCRMSLAEALDISEFSSKVPVIDSRISRAL